MEIRNIKNKANQIFTRNYRLLIPAFYLINCTNLIVQISSSGAVAFISEILLVTLSHGFIHMSLSLVHEDVKEFSLKDIFIGIVHFPRYFPSYIVRKVIILSAMLLCMFPAFGMIYNLAGADFYNVMDDFIYILFSNALRMDLILAFLENYFTLGIAFFVLLGLVVYLYLTVLFILVPCIVEDYDYAWNEALIKSVKMMRGHIADFIHLWIQYIPNYIVYLFGSLLALSLCSFLPFSGYSIYLVISMLILISSYQIRFYQAIALFYIEIRDETKNPHELFRI